MTNLDIPVALALIVGSVLAYLVWLLVQAVQAAERRAGHSGDPRQGDSA